MSGFAQPLTDAAEMKMLLTRATDTLAELCKFLEDYGPQWYTRPQQERAESTLRLLGKRRRTFKKRQISPETKLCRLVPEICNQFKAQ